MKTCSASGESEADYQSTGPFSNCGHKPFGGVYNLSSGKLEVLLSFGTLRNAPIREALIGICLQPGAADLAQIEEAIQHLPDEYQTPKESIHLAQTQLTFGPGAADAANVDRKQLGWRFGSKSRKFAVQARTDWLIFSHLSPYSTWPEFSAEARRVWSVLRDVYQPACVQRLSVRNINEVKLGPGEQVEKYLRFYINVPEGVPQLFNNYFARIELHHSPDINAILQSGLLSVQEHSALLLMDIELLKIVHPQTDNDLWQSVDSLREPKNQIFFSCITREWEARLR